MKIVYGSCWQYKNSKHRGMTWAAELSADNALLCVYGQKNLKSAIQIANKHAKKLGWEMKEPWSRVYKPAASERTKRRNLCKRK